MPPQPAAVRRRLLTGYAKPRIAPPLPLRSDLTLVKATAEKIGFELYPWQLVVFRYLQARGPMTWLWREVATVVARQNGKTSIAELLILVRMLMGHRITHLAQDRALPRESFEHIADLVSAHYRDSLARSGIRTSNGQERIRLVGGGTYRIVAPTRSAARGRPNDLVVIDEVLEMFDTDVVSAAIPTTRSSPEAQIAYFSNAGMPESVVLNALRARAGVDPSLAYLEYSAEQEMAPDDIRGWRHANPSMGHMPTLLDDTKMAYRANLLANTMGDFEREYLCRWTPSLGQAPLLQPGEWERQTFLKASPEGRYCYLAIKMDPSGTRASAVAAWGSDKGVTLELVAEARGDPIPVEEFGPELRRLATKLKARKVAFDPVTDADLIRYFKRTISLSGRDYSAASEKFVRLSVAHQLSVYDPGAILADDLLHTVRINNSNGTYLAAKNSPETTNTAIEAAIRAAWVASAPQPKVVVY